tara:strand:+ start:343 stop:741 length:399 start_codon:yes stop_codon:yes gene_type:complete
MLKSKLNRYYFYGVFPALIVTLVMSQLLHFIDASFYILGFIWPYSYYTPGSREQILNGQKRFSFLGLSFQTHDFIFEKLPQKMLAPLVRLVCPLGFVLLLSLISFSYVYCWVLLGWLSFELFFFISNKYNLV